MSVVVCVVDEMGVKVGREVGYLICFEDCISEKIIFKYMMDGMFLREMVILLILEGYLVIIIDEVYERMVYIDILLVLIKDFIRVRLELKFIILLVIFNVEKFSGYFDGVFIFNVFGRVYFVEVYYIEKFEVNYVEVSIVIVF